MSFELKDFRGVIPALLTPLDESGHYSEKRAEGLIEWLLERKVGGFYITGSTGYGAAMDKDERKRAVESVCRIVGGRVPVAAHIAAVSSGESSELARHAQASGCDAVSAVPSYYYKLTPEQTYRYYEEIASAVDIPLIIYARTNEYAPNVDDIERLASIPNVRGLKYTGSDHYVMGRIKERLGRDFMVYSGYDEMFLSGLLSGADALIGSTYNLYPDLVARAVAELEAGEVEKARADMLATNRMLEVMIRYDTLAAIRSALSFVGVDAGFSPAPFDNLGGEKLRLFRSELTEVVSKLDIEPFELSKALLGA